VDLGREHDEAVARKPFAPPHSRPGELKDVGVEHDPGPGALARGAGEQGTHAQPVHRNLDIAGLDDHTQSLTGEGAGQVRGSHRRDSIDSQVFGRLRGAKERARVQPASKPWPGFTAYSPAALS